MGVPGEGELVAVGVEKLKDAGLGRVEEGEAEVGVAVGGTGDGGVVVEVVVGSSTPAAAMRTGPTLNS